MKPFLAMIAVVLSLGMVSNAHAATNTVRINYVKTKLQAAEVPKDYAASLFADKRLKVYPESVVPRVKPPTTKFSANILAIDSIARGRDFLEAYKDELDQAEETYGVDKEEIVAVMRVESNLGKYMGDLTVWNVFYTRLLTSPEDKWQWDAANLEALGKYCYTAKVDCYSIKGSNAGAYGMAQFLPYSVETWGVDGNNDGVVNLFDVKDSIPSAANFLKEHGYEDSKSGALASYYGSGKTYPAAVLGYADALRESDPQSAAGGDTNQKTSPAMGKVSQLATIVVTKLYCLFSSTPYCQD
jgi:membrane-bound lytic murein transglycosylase B